MQIVLSLLFICAFPGVIIYFNYSNDTSMGICIFLAAAGLIAGIILATKKYKGKGTMEFVSRVSATPELDSKEEGKVEETDKINS
jgi:hypothetical protein